MAACRCCVKGITQKRADALVPFLWVQVLESGFDRQVTVVGRFGALSFFAGKPRLYV
jgi:hypothetical protein